MKKTIPILAALGVLAYATAASAQEVIFVKPSTEPLEESPRCSDDDGKRLTNTDHHGQR